MIMSEAESTLPVCVCVCVFLTERRNQLQSRFNCSNEFRVQLLSKESAISLPFLYICLSVCFWRGWKGHFPHPHRFIHPTHPIVGWPVFSGVRRRGRPSPRPLFASSCVRFILFLFSPLCRGGLNAGWAVRAQILNRVAKPSLAYRKLN